MKTTDLIRDIQQHKTKVDPHTAGYLTRATETITRLTKVNQQLAARNRLLHSTLMRIHETSDKAIKR